MSVRHERSFAHYSRGAELARVLRDYWHRNNTAPRPSAQDIRERAAAICAEFDLTVDEWHHWCGALARRCD